ncbi:hypothetical protein ACLGIH_02820 [Streptomyces sp. HMX87]|uniref:hypothetical protein n=1 Tax=Streptomyces sp. HMX87 TaxID=3390849 RepID=UPI003A8647FD
MTTGSSTSRSNEFAIAPVDLPTAETTTATGTHTMHPPGADPGPRPADPGPGPADPGPRPAADPGPRPAADPGPRPDAGPGPRPAAERGPERAEPAHDEDPPAHRDAAAYGDPVGDLVRAAVADRPLEEVVALITMLEQSPEYAEATVDALRAVGVNRSVEDVTRLVGLLTRPPRHPDSADEALRAAAECRSVEDVTRLMALLHRTPLEPHCGQEAVRAAATGRPVEELVQLIGRLAEERREHADRPDEEPRTFAEDGDPDRPEPPARSGGLTGALVGAGRSGRERRRTPRRVRAARQDARHDQRRDAPRDPRQEAPRDERHDVRREARRPAAARAVAWPAWLAVAALAGCGVAFFPPRPDGASVRVYAVALGLSALCLVLALLLTVRPAVPVLAAAVVAPAGLAAARLYGSATPSARLSRVTELTLAPAWVAVAVAVGASLVALTALCVRVASQAAAGRWQPRPAAGTSRPAD